MCSTLATPGEAGDSSWRRTLLDAVEAELSGCVPPSTAGGAGAMKILVADDDPTSRLIVPRRRCETSATNATP